MSTTRPLVCLLSRSNVFGWPPTLSAQGRPNTPAGADHVAYLPLADALRCRADSDLHLVAYSRPDRPHRLNDGAPEQLPGGVPMVLLILEVDCPKNRREDGHASAAWREEERPKIEALLADEPGVLCALSRGGYRLIAWLSPPHHVVDADSARTWSEFYLLAGADLFARYGIKCDPNCRDWQHLQRAPHALRNGEREPGIFLGAAPEAVGDWDLDRFDPDRAEAAARELARGHENWRRGVAYLDRVEQVVPTTAPPRSQQQLDAAEIVIDYIRPAVAAVGEGGGRHMMYMALAGTLLDRGVDPQDLPRLIAELSVRAGVDDARLTQDRFRTAQSTIARCSAGETYSRIGVLAQHYPDVARALDEVLPPTRPPGEEAVLRALCRTQAAPGGPGLGEGSDLDVAEVCLHAVQQRGAQIVHDRDEFWVYDGGLWRPGAQRLIELEVHGLNGAPYGEKGRYKVNEPRVKGAVKRAATIVSAPGFFDGAPRGVAFRNGFLRIDEQGQVAMLPLAEEHRVLECLPYDYDEDARCPIFDRILLDVFAPDEDGADKAQLVQEFVGSCLLAIAVLWQRCLVFEGASGDNGKSTILSIVQELFPESMRRSIPPQKWDSEYYVAKLAGCRFNSVAEMPKTDLDNTEVFKAVISGDRLTGRHPSGRPFDYHPIAGHAFACNELPGTSDQTDAYWKRFMPLQFNRRFIESEQDKGISERVIAAEMPGIAAWAVRGARSAIARGSLIIPASVTRRKAEWRRQSDQVALFAEEKLELGGDRGTPAAQVFMAFSEWAKNSGHRGMSSQKFEGRLSALGWVFDRGTWRCGLRGGAHFATSTGPHVFRR